MSAQANIVLADGQTPPVNHTFEPDGAYNKDSVLVSARWIDRTGHPLMIGRAVLKEDHRRPDDGIAKERIRHVVEIPTMESVNGVLTRTRSAVIDCEVRFEPGVTQAERDSAAAYAKSLTASAYFMAKVKTGERTW